MSLKGDEYRALSKEQANASKELIGKADPMDEVVKLDLAVMAHVKATIYAAAADIFDELSAVRNSSPMQARQELYARLRRAAVANDTEAMDQIAKELQDKLDGS